MVMENLIILGRRVAIILFIDESHSKKDNHGGSAVVEQGRSQDFSHSEVINLCGPH